MICTSIEQSTELVRLGLDPKTADMWWSNRFVYWNSTPMICVATEQNQLYTFKWCEMDVPAWSLSALLEVISKVTCISYLTIDSSFLMRCKDLGFLWQKDIAAKDPVTAAYEMVCWLLEQGLIKKEEKI